MDWDRKMGEYEVHAAALVDAIRSRHQAELTDFQQALLAKQQRPKFSRELLNLRKIQVCVCFQLTPHTHGINYIQMSTHQSDFSLSLSLLSNFLFFFLASL
jgi:hypothetical protein